MKWMIHWTHVSNVFLSLYELDLWFLHLHQLTWTWIKLALLLVVFYYFFVEGTLFLLTKSACQIIRNWFLTPLYYFLHYEPVPYANHTFNLLASVFFYIQLDPRPHNSLFFPTKRMPDISVLASCHIRCYVSFETQ